MFVVSFRIVQLLQRDADSVSNGGEWAGLFRHPATTGNLDEANGRVREKNDQECQVKILFGHVPILSCQDWSTCTVLVPPHTWEPATDRNGSTHKTVCVQIVIRQLLTVASSQARSAG